MRQTGYYWVWVNGYAHHQIAFYKEGLWYVIGKTITFTDASMIEIDETQIIRKL